MMYAAGLAAGAAIWQDFADLGDLSQLLHVLLRLLVAAILGGFLGYQREHQGKAAGLRTHMLVTLGAALFMVVADVDHMSSADRSRVVQGIVTGIGFLGGGVILKLSEEKQVRGLTTAASVWIATGIGIAAGMGKLWPAVLGTLAAVAILGSLQRLENWIDEGTVPGKRP